jgi:thiamine transporter ThiT
LSVHKKHDLFLSGVVTVTALFGGVVEVVFQNVFRLEMHQNIFFYFLKFIFNISTSKRSKNTHKKKKLKLIFFFKSTVGLQCQTRLV